MMKYSREWSLSLPSMIWLTVFFIIPSLIIFLISFKTASPMGGVVDTWTLTAWKELINPNYPDIIIRTLRVSIKCTFLCIVIALPFAYCMGTASKKLQKWLLVLVIIPFWTNFLIRVFAWKSVLHPEGMLKNFLVSIGLMDPDTLLLYNENAVILVTVYTYLPFAIMPLYASIEKFDFTLMEAAYDLGAKKITVFFRVFLPGIKRGIQTAVFMVFIPALGSYVIPDVVGGRNSEMMGNKIAQRVFSDRNLPHAAALSAILCIGVIGLMITIAILIRRHQRKELK